VIEADLNRAFPGKASGDKAQRHTWRIWRDIRSRAPDFLVDLHTDSGAAIPYAIVDRVVRGRRQAELFAECLRVAGASGLTVLAEYPRDLYLRYRLDHSLPGAVINTMGVPAITLEVGPRNYIPLEAVATGMQAILGVLAAVGVVDEPMTGHVTRREGGPWRRASGPVIQSAGMFVPAVVPGQWVSSGELLGTIRNLDGTVAQHLRAPLTGFVVSLLERTWMQPSQTCVTLGVVDAR
jgi:predicted deacylase